MLAGRHNLHEIPETPEANAIDQLEDDIGDSSSGNDDGEHSDFVPSGPTTPLNLGSKKKGEDKSKVSSEKRQDEQNQNQHIDSSERHGDSPSEKQQDIQKKRAQTSESEIPEMETPRKRPKVILRTSTGGRRGQDVGARPETVAEGLRLTKKTHSLFLVLEKQMQAMGNRTFSEYTVADLTQKIMELTEENEELKSRNEQFKRQTLRMVSYVDDLNDKVDSKREDYQKVCDDEIESKWGRIAFRIRTLVMCHSTKAPRKKSNLQEPQISHEIRERPHLSQYLLQRYIWVKITRSIFQGGQGIWCGNMASSLDIWRKAVTEQCINDHSQGHIYGHIKSEAAHEIFKILGINTDARDRFIENMVSELAYFSIDKKRCHTQLSNIVDQALTLQSIFMKSKALFMVGTKDLGPSKHRLLAEGEFECIHSSSDDPDKNYSKLTIVPVLLKIGNADGFKGSYDGQVVVCKAQVVYD